jgi:predicted Zn finger-like uncharacterized protein
MPASRFTCPECDATIRLSPTAPAGRKVRCPECDALVRPPTDDDAPAPAARRSSRRDDDDDRPRRSGSRGKKKAQKSNAPLIIAASVILVLLLAGGVAAVVLSLKDKKTEASVVADAGPQGGPKAKGPAGAPKAVAPPKASGPRVVGLNVGNEAPEIEAEDLDGETFKLSDYRGKVVLLDFWGDW